MFVAGVTTSLRNPTGNAEPICLAGLHAERLISVGNYGGYRCLQRVGDSSLANLAIDLRSSSAVNRDILTVIDRFGEWTRSNGTLTYGGCALKTVVGIAIS